jgi:chemotaxis protein histidine kinase CheA
MSDIDQQLQQLRENYLRDLTPRFDALEQHLTRLIDEEFPQAPFQEFLRLIHNLAGSSGLFGLDELQTASRDLEERIAAHVAAATRPDEPEIRRLKRGLADLRQSI